MTTTTRTRRRLPPWPVEKPMPKKNLSPWNEISPPTRPGKIRRSKGRKTRGRDMTDAEVAELEAKHDRQHGSRVRKYEERMASGVIGECFNCGINVYADTQRPADYTMPCNVPGCPFERPEDQDKSPLTLAEIERLVLSEG